MTTGEQMRRIENIKIPIVKSYLSKTELILMTLQNKILIIDLAVGSFIDSKIIMIPFGQTKTYSYLKSELDLVRFTTFDKNGALFFFDYNVID